MKNQNFSNFSNFPKIAIVGATGMVGRTMIKVLEERNFLVDDIYFFASEKSEGKIITFRGKDYPIEILNEESFDRDIDICLFAAGEAISFQYAKIAQAKGIIVIDNSSTWRQEVDVPLVIPEVNVNDLNYHHNLVSNPNCVTIQSVIPLSVLHEAYRIKRVLYTTYQAVSGSGDRGDKDLKLGIEGYPPLYYPKPIAYNCLPQIDEFKENGYTIEELKMINETKKILHDNKIKISATCVRIPVQNGHSIAINVELEKPFTIEEVILKLKAKVGLKVYDFPEYPTAKEASNQDLVYVGRIRRDNSIENGIHLWVVADNIRKGAATNAIQIAEILWRNKLK